MTVNLKKGESFELCDAQGKPVQNVIVGLGWDAAVPKKKGILGLFSPSAPQIDCDATVLMCKNGKVCSFDDVVFYDALKHKSGSVEHLGDNRTGEGDGDDERIVIHPLLIPADYDKLAFIVNIFEPVPRKQHFGMIANAFIRFINADNDEEICRFDLSENYDNKTAMIFGELTKDTGNWKFNAMGKGTTDTCLEDAVKSYQ